MACEKEEMREDEKQKKGIEEKWEEERRKN